MTTFEVTPSVKALPPGLAPQAWRAELLRAAKVWSYPQVPCTSFHIAIAEPSSQRLAVEDGVNAIVFREGRWCHNERCGPGTTFPLQTMGMTATYPEGARGSAVREADIELNRVKFSFDFPGAMAGEPTKPLVSLHAVLVHELGHVAGLKDACGAHRSDRPPDAKGCPTETKASVMFAPALRTELTSEDMAELCAIHPRDGDGVAKISETPTVKNGFEVTWALGMMAGVAMAIAAWRVGRRWRQQ